MKFPPLHGAGQLRPVKDRVMENPFRFGISRRAMVASLAALPMLGGALSCAFAQTQNASPLPSWNDGLAKQAIIDFVNAVTREGSPDFVPVAERIATFDNDGTLWCEQPMYVQLAFVLDRVKALAPQNPDWKSRQPFEAVLSGNMNALAASGEKGLVEFMAATHAGMTTDEFANIVSEWIAAARHPRFNWAFTECVYQPMLEVLDYLRAHEFKTFIVSGGGIEFMRPWTERVYGIAPEQVVGSSIKTRCEMRDGRPTFFRLREINFIDDKAGKPVGINQHIGRRPIAAFGNSDGDLQMLQWGDPGRRSTASRADRASYRCRTRICLRPQLAYREAGSSPRWCRPEPMDRRQYEGRLEPDLPAWARSAGSGGAVASLRPTLSGGSDHVWEIGEIHRTARHSLASNWMRGFEQVRNGSEADVAALPIVSTSPPKADIGKHLGRCQLCARDGLVHAARSVHWYSQGTDGVRSNTMRWGLREPPSSSVPNA